VGIPKAKKKTECLALYTHFGPPQRSIREVH